jgi:TPR repeat protein
LSGKRVYQALAGNQQATLVEFQDSELLTDETMPNHRFLIFFLFLSILPFKSAAQDVPDPKQAELEMSVRVWSMTGVELKELISKAQSGDAQAQYWVGIKCQEGQLESTDPKEAPTWFLKSAQQGFAPAQRTYGKLVANNNPPEGERWLLRAAERGDADAEMWLGAAYEQNWFGTVDLQESIKWYRKAAEAGQVDAQMLLGNRYEMGHGVEQNYALAAQWYRKAAEHVLPLSTGASEARYRLALLYIEGHGVPQDYVQAYFWLRLVGPEENVNKAKAHMTAAQIDEGEELVKRWKEHHRLKPEIARAYDIKEEP